MTIRLQNISARNSNQQTTQVVHTLCQAINQTGWGALGVKLQTQRENALYKMSKYVHTKVTSERIINAILLANVVDLHSIFLDNPARHDATLVNKLLPFA